MLERDRLDEALAMLGALGLGSSWFHTGPAGLTELGLPPGLEERATVRTFGGLEVHLPAREDLVAFKLYAAVDQGERSSTSPICAAFRRHLASCWTPPGGPGRTIRRPPS